jgi:hypothetical protein
MCYFSEKGDAVMRKVVIFKYFLLLGIFFNISQSQIFCGTTPDSCLKLLLPPEGYSEIISGPFNPDSVKADSCLDSHTFGAYYARHTFELIFHKNFFSPKLIPKDSAVTWDLISDEYPYIKQKFEELEIIFGKYYWLRHPESNDASHIRIPQFYLYFDEYVEIDSIKNFIYTILPDSIFLWHLNTPVYHFPGVEELLSDDIISISPNPASEYIEINFERCPASAGCRTSEIIQIYNVLGECVKRPIPETLYPKPKGHTPNPSQEGNVRVDISDLPVGVYFVRISDKIKKVVKY